MLGNVGTHKFGEQITAADVYLSLTQFLPILEWYFEVERKLPLDSFVPNPIQGASPVDPDLLLARAHGLMAERKWPEAAALFTEYAQYRPDDWQAHYSRAVAFANSRRGPPTSLSSLRAYNDAIACAPPGTADDVWARMFAYRGAMLKRLGRLDEAESDLYLAMKHASRSFEIDDIRYNLAGVFALRGDRARMMEMIASLRDAPDYLSVIRAHLGDYFAAFRTDEEFLRAIDA
jgi:tetratricopeptide (TPR) repeat protein